MICIPEICSAEWAGEGEAVRRPPSEEADAGVCPSWKGEQW